MDRKSDSKIEFVSFFMSKCRFVFFKRQIFKKTNFFTVVNKNAFMKEKMKNRIVEYFILEISLFRLSFNLFRSFHVRKFKR